MGAMNRNKDDRNHARSIARLIRLIRSGWHAIIWQSIVPRLIFFGDVRNCRLHLPVGLNIQCCPIFASTLAICIEDLD